MLIKGTSLRSCIDEQGHFLSLDQLGRFLTEFDLYTAAGKN